jgi:hypothetical protein
MKVAALANSVELASVVRMMPRCQTDRSAAKAKPASAVSPTIPKVVPAKPAGLPPGARTTKASASRNGTASACRQKAEASGPTSANRTSHGPKARQADPVIMAGKAQRAPACAELSVLPMEAAHRGFATSRKGVTQST